MFSYNFNVAVKHTKTLVYFSTAMHSGSLPEVSLKKCILLNNNAYGKYPKRLCSIFGGSGFQVSLGAQIQFFFIQSTWLRVLRPTKSWYLILNLKFWMSIGGFLWNLNFHLKKNLCYSKIYLHFQDTILLLGMICPAGLVVIWQSFQLGIKHPFF